MKLHWQIFIALGLAIVAGLLTPVSGLQEYLIPAYDFFGTLFLNALKMLIVPLIVASVISSLLNLGSGPQLGRYGAMTVAYYLSTSLLAILVGLFWVNLFTPGLIDGEPGQSQLGLDASTESVLSNMEGRGAGDIVAVFLRLVPTNVFLAAAEGQMLGLIFFSLLFGFFITRLPVRLSEVQKGFWEGIYEVMISMTNFIMLLAPLGVFALVAEVMATTGWVVFRSLGLFVLTVLLSLGTHMLVTLPLMLMLVAKVNPLRQFHAMAPALLTAFSTSSSSATLPVTLRCVEERAGVPKETSSLVLPLGATINMDGTALFECVAALFIAQAYGLEMTFGIQFVVVFTALLTSIGVAGIPSASLVAIGVILAAIGLPLEGVGLILAVDRVLDMCRTSVNVFSDGCGAVIIARLAGQKGVLEQPVASA